MHKIASIDLRRSNFSIALFQLKSADLAGNLYSSFSKSSWRHLYPFDSLLCLYCDYGTRVYPYAQRESGLSLAAIYKESFDILLTVHLNIFILILTNLMH